MTDRGEAVENEQGWARECDPSRAWVLGDMADDYRTLVSRIMDGLVDLAAMGIDPKSGSLYEDPAPMPAAYLRGRAPDGLVPDHQTPLPGLPRTGQSLSVQRRPAAFRAR